MRTRKDIEEQIVKAVDLIEKNERDESDQFRLGKLNSGILLMQNELLLDIRDLLTQTKEI